MYGSGSGPTETEESRLTETDFSPIGRVLRRIPIGPIGLGRSRAHLLKRSVRTAAVDELEPKTARPDRVWTDIDVLYHGACECRVRLNYPHSRLLEYLHHHQLHVL